MKTNFLLLITILGIVELGLSQEIEIIKTPSIEVVSIDSDVIDFIYPIIISDSINKTSKCNNFYWYLHELNDEIILTKTPLSSILLREVLYDNFISLFTTFRDEKMFISIKANSILNKKINKTNFFIDFNDFDSMPS
jgi:hypothetical protein